MKVVLESAVEVLQLAVLTEDQPEAIFELGREVVVFTQLELAKRLAESQGNRDPSITPSTLSGMVLIYKKPPAGSRKKQPGAKKGHPDSRRHVNEWIDREETHQFPCCPQCGGRLKRTGDFRQLYIEETPDIDPKVTEALPRSMLGNRVLLLSAWLHYVLGNTLSEIVEVFNFHLQLKILFGGLTQMWYRLQAILYAWYEEIQLEALKSAVSYAGETGWRVGGETLHELENTDKYKSVGQPSPRNCAD